jgi:hypothetical protein
MREQKFPNRFFIIGQREEKSRERFCRRRCGKPAAVEQIKLLENAVLKSLVQWLRLPKTADALEGYEFMRKLYTKRIYPTVEVIRKSIHVLGRTNKKFRGLKAEDLVDDRIVWKLEKEGAF